MKKGILALAMASALLALPVAASGDALRAQGGDDFQISFTLTSRGGEPTALKRFKFSRLDTPCATGPVIQARGRLPFIDVNDRNRFSDSLTPSRQEGAGQGEGQRQPQGRPRHDPRPGPFQPDGSELRQRQGEVGGALAATTANSLTAVSGIFPGAAVLVQPYRSQRAR